MTDRPVCCECDRPVGIVSFLVGAVGSPGPAYRYCGPCWVGSLPEEQRGERPRKCAWCGLIVDVATAVYVKTRDSYYCEENGCQLQERRAKQQQRREWSSQPVSETGTVARSRRASRNTSGCAGASASSTEAPSPAETGAPSASKISLERSRTAPYEHVPIQRALWREGLDFAADPEVTEVDGMWSVAVVGYATKDPGGTRLMKREGKRWVVHKVRTKREDIDQMDPLGARVE